MICTPVSGHWMDLFIAIGMMGFSMLFGLVVGVNIMIPNPKTQSSGPK